MNCFSLTSEYKSIKVMEQYLTNLADKQWQVIENIINPQGRKRKKLFEVLWMLYSTLLKPGANGVCFPRILQLGKVPITTSANGRRRSNFYLFFPLLFDEGVPYYIDTPSLHMVNILLQYSSESSHKLFSLFHCQ